MLCQDACKQNLMKVIPTGNSKVWATFEQKNMVGLFNDFIIATNFVLVQCGMFVIIIYNNYPHCPRHQLDFYALS